MFVGTIPKPAVEQALDCTDLGQWPAIFVCCSGSFRWERVLRVRYPQIRLVGCDVSIYSVAIGRFLAGDPLSFTFRERLASFEERLAERPPIDRLAFLVVALQMATYRGKNAHARAMFDSYVENIEGHAGAVRSKISDLAREVGNYEFFAGDFRVHGRQAIAEGAAIVGAPPIIKGDYERFYRFLDENVAWDPPAYDLWDPTELPDWLRSLEAANAPYCVVSHYTPAEGFEPTFRYDVGLRPRRSIFGYTNRSVATSLRGRSTKAEPFAYRPVDPDQITAKSKVTLVRVSGEHANFLKDIYLQRGLVHTDGNMRFFVYIDGALAGCFIYAKSTKGDTQNEIYLLSDFPVNPARRLAKLICMLATGREPISIARKHFLLPLVRVHTTAFSDKPVSMKYRGVFELRSRKDGGSIGAESKAFQLSYVSKVREKSCDEIFREWFKRYARNAGPPGADQPTGAAAGQPALHDLAAVRAVDAKHPPRRSVDQPAAGL